MSDVGISISDLFKKLKYTSLLNKKILTNLIRIFMQNMQINNRFFFKSEFVNGEALNEVNPEYEILLLALLPDYSGKLGFVIFKLGRIFVAQGHLVVLFGSAYHRVNERYAILYLLRIDTAFIILQ